MAKIRRKQIDLTLAEGPTDGTYGSTNAANLQNTDKLEDAFDKVSVILDALVPPSAPTLSSISESITGVVGKLSFGSTNTIAGYDNHPTVGAKSAITISGTSLGIINGTTNFTGTLADNTAQGTGSPNPAYPANAFGQADQGTLTLRLDGNIIHTVDLTSFGSGSTLNANGSGFTLSAATSVVFSSGTQFPSFKYRTGTFVVNNAEWATAGRGYKTVQVVHTIGGSTYSTQTWNFIVDAVTTAITASANTLGSLSMAGSRYLSGVQYHQSGTAAYGVTLSNVYLNTYSTSASAISYTVTNGTIASEAIPDWVTSHTDNLVLSKTVTISSSSTRLLGVALTVATNVARTVQTAATGLGSTSQFLLLLDTVTSGSTDTAEGFDTENYRVSAAIETNRDVTAGYASGGTRPAAVQWDSTQSLVGASSAHNTGLMVFNSGVSYPTRTTGTGITNGNFSAVTNGPASNVNYSGATGNRVYYRYYWLPSKSNFVMTVNATSTAFVASSTTPTGNNLNIEILAPSQTKDGSNATVWKDCVTAYTADTAVGAYNASGGANVGNISGSNWGLTIGTKTTANSGNVIILKITASSSWTGVINSINIV